MMNGRILITGGTGTLGHAIVRQAMLAEWDAQITIYSRSELAQAKMRAKYPDLHYVLGDVRDYERLAAAFAGHDIVIHAAAMKRIPEAEAHPRECYLTNVLGSENVVRAALSVGVPRVVGISTDKACRAITQYGASKLMMEKLFQAQSVPGITFTLVRYGNVVASNGSVIPIWKQAVAEGRTVKVTDARCTRFFMPEEQAVGLIESAVESPAGTILVPKMGKLNIVDMARLVVPGAQIIEVGLRSCEKLHEDLVHTDEPAMNLGGSFIVGRGSPGLHYTSEIAPDIEGNEFLQWVREAEERDV